MAFVKHFLPVTGCWWGKDSRKDAESCLEWLLNTHDLSVTLESSGPQESRIYSHLAGCYFHPDKNHLIAFGDEARRIKSLLNSQVAARISGRSCAEEAYAVWAVRQGTMTAGEMKLLFEYVEMHNFTGIKELLNGTKTSN